MLVSIVIEHAPKDDRILSEQINIFQENSGANQKYTECTFVDMLFYQNFIALLSLIQPCLHMRFEDYGLF